MKRHYTESTRYGCVLCAVAALMIVGAGAWAAETTEQVVNLIVNADFENGDAGWDLRNGAVTDEAPHGGNACLRMDRTEKGGTIALQFITIEPDTWYVCEFQYKVTGTPGPSQIRFLGEQVKGEKTIPSQVYQFDRYAKDQWTRGVSHIYSGKGGKCELEISVFREYSSADESLPATASLWLDDLVLRPMTSEDMKGELIENGNFEDGRPGDLPPGWVRHSDRRKKLPTVALTDKEAHGGKQALQITMGAPQDVEGKDAFVKTAGRRRLALGRTYTLSFWAKASQAADSRLALLGPANHSNDIHLTPEWQQFSREVVLTPKQQAAAKWGPAFAVYVIGPLTLENVTFWYDDISLRPAGQ